MTLIETPPETRSRAVSSPVRDIDVLVSRRIPTGASEIHELAKHMAFGAVTGYLEHDRASKENREDGREKAVDGFFQVYLYCFPEISSVTAYKAAELYVKSLFKQDEIEEHPGHSKEEILNDPKWSEVKDILQEFSRTLGLPDSYAEQTMNFFRHHGVRDARYVIYCLESEKIFWTKVLGDDYWTKMLGSLLILLTDCHDKHDQKGLETGLEFATKYFEIVLKAITSKRHQILAPLGSELPHSVK
jgi:hypothetical protein